MTYLRKITAEDAAPLIRWRNENAEHFPPGPAVTLSSHQKWFANYLKDPLDHMYMVCSPFPVGTVAINAATGEIGRVLRGEPESPGAMREGLLELMRVYGKREYFLYVLPDNKHAIDFYEELGFVKWRHLVRDDGTEFQMMLRLETTND